MDHGDRSVHVRRARVARAAAQGRVDACGVARHRIPGVVRGDHVRGIGQAVPSDAVGERRDGLGTPLPARGGELSPSRTRHYRRYRRLVPRLRCGTLRPTGRARFLYPSRSNGWGARAGSAHASSCRRQIQFPRSSFNSAPRSRRSSPGGTATTSPTSCRPTGRESPSYAARSSIASHSRRWSATDATRLGRGDQDHTAVGARANQVTGERHTRAP